MSHMASGILGTVAATLALGAVHLEVAAGNDLLGPAQRGDASLRSSSTDPSVNRSTKGDREGAGRADGVTISYRIPGVTDSSVMMRIPSAEATADKRAPVAVDDVARLKKRQEVACEPSVSALTAVAKQLQPARCLT